ncbi:beta-glucuronidase [Pseudoclavibacter sp. JAI123]|uniref:beta-glucuronidase n=1 Tax=Pseudoclavibacter sp. JAI123 TaxID=2723065 RepID=UPI0015CA1A83|nr:beta-glucuronidase [Pseudoclavibacter sp. JAI123]NYF12259.1 beta-glucuronidase [Pseudoclavibacter sp. JAI123]
MLKPKPTPTRELVNLDGVWKFGIDTRLGDEPWSGPLQTPLEAAVPASYNDLFTDPEIRNHVGWVYYQREVRVPRGWGSERVLLRFDAATHAARVYVGDQLVGEHVGGYTPFDIDITDLAPAGSAFRLTVAVSGDLTNETIPPGKIEVGFDGKRKQTYFHDFYNYAGLARSVSLHSVPVRSISDVTVRTTFEDKVGAVDYQVDAADGLDVRVRLADASGAVVATADGAAGVLTVQDVTLWQPGAAYLYELTVEALDGSDIVDSYPVPVGVRTVEVRGAEFLVNGEPFYFTGFGKHEDTTVRGKGHDNAYLVHDFQLLEWTGANSFRTSHYPYAEEVLEFADRHGILVIDETAAVGLNMGVVGGMSGTPPFPTFSEQYANERTQAAHEQHLRELITRDKNHPSVVMWSIANEPASNEDGAREYFEPLVNLVREMDPTRPITYSLVMFATFKNDQIIDLFDVVSINRYYGWYVTAGDLASAELMLEGDLRGWIERTGKPIMMSEYGADTQEGLHSVWDQVWTEEYQASFLAMYHRVFDRLPEFVGEQVWNFADFATTNGLHRVGGNRKGVFTRDRKPKAAAHELRRRWRGLDGRKPGSDD